MSCGKTTTPQTMLLKILIRLVGGTLWESCVMTLHRYQSKLIEVQSHNDYNQSYGGYRCKV